MKVFAARDAARRRGGAWKSLMQRWAQPRRCAKKGRFRRSPGRAAMARPSSGRRSSRRPRRPFLPEARKGLAEEESRLPRGGASRPKAARNASDGATAGQSLQERKNACREGRRRWPRVGREPAFRPFPERSSAEGAAGARRARPSSGRRAARGRARTPERHRAWQTGRGSG